MVDNLADQMEYNLAESTVDHLAVTMELQMAEK